MAHLLIVKRVLWMDWLLQAAPSDILLGGALDKGSLLNLQDTHLFKPLNQHFRFMYKFMYKFMYGFMCKFIYGFMYGFMY